VPIVTGSSGRKFAEPTIFSAIPNASAEIVKVSITWLYCLNLNFLHL
jgi:hypothetical protein